MPSSILSKSRFLQRKCACGQHTVAGGECAECRKKRLQRKATDHTDLETVPPIVHEVLRSPGQPLNAGTRAFMEPRFGHDFSQVRVHTDARAAESARAVNALAYTVGQDVVFGAGQYAPGTVGGKRLLAHELTHAVQQGAQSRLQSKLDIGPINDQYEQEADYMADAVSRDGTFEVGQAIPSPGRSELTQGRPHPDLAETVQRQPTDGTNCPNYQSNEVRVSHTEAGHLASDVIRLGPDRLLIADFGVDWRHVKSSTKTNPLLQSWLSIFNTNDSYRLEITGYSDCVGTEGRNTDLRQGRAAQVEQLLEPSARSRVTFRGMAGLGSYINDNNSVESRARNRGVVINFHQEFTFPAEEVSVTPKNCGPDSTQWLIDQMNTNRNHPVIRTSREVQWPNYIPIFNLGWNYGFLKDFRDLVRAGGPWDFKSNQTMWRAGAGRTCPSQACNRTVTLCGRCFNYDVPGNIHYGWIGRQAGLRAWFLHNRAAAAQAGGVDDPKDTVAIDIGIDMADKGVALCDEIRNHGDQLNRDRTEGCFVCTRT